MKTYRVLCITRSKKYQDRLEKAVTDKSIVFSKVDSPAKALDLIAHQTHAFIVFHEGFKDDQVEAFFIQLGSLHGNEELHVLYYGNEESRIFKYNEIYKNGVIDFLPQNSSFNYLSTKIEIYKRLHRKRRRIDELLANILPEQVAEELERKGKYPPRRHGLVTVMFTDFVRFTEKAEKVEAVELVNQLDWFYRKFDRIIKDHKLEKIKTIGDAYMCAGGVPKRIGMNPIRVTLAAMAIREMMLRLERQNKFYGKQNWALRIGINSGPLVSGIVGDLKYSYDIWGETVNVAARMESSGVAGKINVSHQTWHYIKDYFNCTYRGQIEAKYMGKVEMYFVEDIKPEWSINGNGKKPNTNLKKIAGIITLDFEGAKNHILSRLRNELPDYLFYHSVNHTLDVLKSIQYLGAAEGVSDEDQLLLNTAALYHDCGYIETYHGNEENAIKIVRKTLPNYGYTTHQITTICSIIRSTKMRAIPKTKLQKIMNDADYDYLGRRDYHKIARTLQKELRTIGLTGSRKEWIDLQIKFLERHRFYTETAIREKLPQKLQIIQELKISKAEK